MTDTPQPVTRKKPFAVDLATCRRDYLEAFVALLIASGFAVYGVVDVTVVQKAALAAPVPVVALLKGVTVTWTARRHGDAAVRSPTGAGVSR